MAYAEDLFSEGDLFTATVEEVQDTQTLIVGYQGYLFRVINSTGKLIYQGDRLQLLVVGLKPIELRLLDAAPGKFGRSVNRFA